ncbi:MAG: hypothetical protein HFG27_11625 [Provencibacterium sp.]|jgi:hypothetical protein|nr:hypothetical protein [Provencibacterium sp.]
MERLKNMEKDIRYLLTQDQQAQAFLRENQQRRQQMADEITRIQEEMQREKFDNAQQQVDRIRQQNKEAYEQELCRLHASYKAALQELDEAYQSHQAQWVETIMRRCLE